MVSVKSCLRGGFYGREERSIVVRVDIHAGEIWWKGRNVFRASGELIEDGLKLCLRQLREGCPIVEKL
jgi:hypothetical protein